MHFTFEKNRFSFFFSVLKIVLCVAALLYQISGTDFTLYWELVASVPHQRHSLYPLPSYHSVHNLSILNANTFLRNSCSPTFT